MTLINRLIAQAKAGATVLEVPENHVRSVAEHMRQSLGCNGLPATHEECEAAIRAGAASLLDVRMKVVAKPENEKPASANRAGLGRLSDGGDGER